MPSRDIQKSKHTVGISRWAKNRQSICSSRVFFVVSAAAWLLLVSARISEAQMSASEIRDIQKAIDAGGASWTAGENDITRLTVAERRAMLGGLETPSGAPDRPQPQPGAFAAPAAFSWGNKDGHNWLTAIKNQGSCGSCWAFAACGAFEARERIRTGQWNLFIDVAEQNMVSCWHDCNAWDLYSTLENFRVNGCPGESCFPYTSTSGSVAPCANRCTDWDTRAYYVTSHGYWYMPGVTAIKNEILANGPLPVWMMIYTDFYSYVGGIYQQTSGVQEGGHFVVVYGWDDATNCWLVKNSWGTGWGETGPNGQTGWFRIRMGTNEAGCETWVYYLNTQGYTYPRVASTTPNEYEPGGSASGNITVTFDTGMDPTTIDASTIFVNGSMSGPHAATISYDGPSRTAVIDPATDFLAGEPVSIVMSPEIKTTDGMWLSTGYDWMFTTSVNSGTGVFGSATDYATPSGPLGVCSGDLNGEGFPDLVSANASAGNLSVRLAIGDGTFGTSNLYAVGSGPRSVTACDLNGDGYLDLAVANSLASTISILMNNGNGTFGSATPTMTLLNPRCVVAADLDADGDLDLAVANPDAKAIRFHFNNGGSLAVSVQRSVAGHPYSLAVGDLDGDGDYDVSYPSYTTDEFCILWNDGPGTFDSETRMPVGDGPRTAAISDINRDGLVDIVVGNYSASTLSVLTNIGLGRYTTTTISTGLLKPEVVNAADLNGDGFPDLAVYGSTGVSILANKGDGTFTEAVSLASGAYLDGVAADFDGDRDLDLAAVSYSGQKISVLHNLPCVDSDGDGVGDPGNFGSFCGIDNCPTVPNPDQLDTDGDGIGNACETCCLGRVGDVNASGDDEPTIGDVSTLIDAKFITGSCDGIITCLEEGDINQSGGPAPVCDDITVGDISMLIDYLFITGSSLGLPNCL